MIILWHVRKNYPRKKYDLYVILYAASTEYAERKEFQKGHLKTLQSSLTIQSE